jgi:hypothetical protein
LIVLHVIFILQMLELTANQKDHSMRWRMSSGRQRPRLGSREQNNPSSTQMCVEEFANSETAVGTASADEHILGKTIVT